MLVKLHLWIYLGTLWALALGAQQTAQAPSPSTASPRATAPQPQGGGQDNKGQGNREQGDREQGDIEQRDREPQAEKGLEPAKNPFEAYRDGDYQGALEGFVERQIEQPENRALDLAVGSANYQLGKYQDAERSYRRATESDDPGIKSQSLYNLGNTLYRQGRLQDAIDQYEQALDLAPGDADAKHNLELVRRFLEQQQQQQQQQGGKNQQQQGDGQDQPQQDSGQQQSQDQSGAQQGQAQASEPDQKTSEGDQQQQAAAGTPSNPDSDADGLPDQVERQGANPTDPNDPDTDHDGRKDGEEDQNANGQVDPGESDPNVPDQPPGQSPPQDQDGDQDAQQAQAAGDPSQLSPEEAERLLAALNEQRPSGDDQHKQARRRKVEKDW